MGAISLVKGIPEDRNEFLLDISWGRDEKSTCNQQQVTIFGVG